MGVLSEYKFNALIEPLKPAKICPVGFKLQHLQYVFKMKGTGGTNPHHNSSWHRFTK